MNGNETKYTVRPILVTDESTQVVIPSSSHMIIMIHCHASSFRNHCTNKQLKVHSHFLKVFNETKQNHIGSKHSACA